jgi:hypothetical protein
MPKQIITTTPADCLSHLKLTALERQIAITRIEHLVDCEVSSARQSAIEECSVRVVRMVNATFSEERNPR